MNRNWVSNGKNKFYASLDRFIQKYFYIKWNRQVGPFENQTKKRMVAAILKQELKKAGT
jgi:hypothetical protein